MYFTIARVVCRRQRTSFNLRRWSGLDASVQEAQSAGVSRVAFYLKGLLSARCDLLDDVRRKEALEPWVRFWARALP